MEGGKARAKAGKTEAAGAPHPRPIFSAPRDTLISRAIEKRAAGTGLLNGLNVH